jgi:predicted ATPase
VALNSEIAVSDEESKPGANLLLAFRVANFRSIKDEVELSLVMPGWRDEQGMARYALPPTGRSFAGSVAALYGANASGKSTLLEALSTMTNAVRRSHQGWPTEGAPHQPFMFDEVCLKSPSLFEVDLLINQKRHVYGFRLDQTGVASEWLYEIPNNRRRLWFERERLESGETTFKFGKSLGGRASTLRELTRSNSLFLSVGAANNHAGLAQIARWFTVHVRKVLPGDRSGAARYTASRLSDPGFAARVAELLRYADLGIAAAKAGKPDVPDDFKDRLRRSFEILAPDSPMPPDEMFELPPEVEFEHMSAGLAGTIPLSRESQGTQSWFGLLGFLFRALDTGSLLLVDELDSSLHPLLCAQFVRMFHDPKVNEKFAQLIFTTHDTTLLGHLLDTPPLRVDEVWLAEKDRDGATHLTPLAEFRVRKGDNVERRYLQGRFGAVPILAAHLPRELVASDSYS